MMYRHTNYPNLAFMCLQEGVLDNTGSELCCTADGCPEWSTAYNNSEEGIIPALAA